MLKKVKENVFSEKYGLDIKILNIWSVFIIPSPPPPSHFPRKAVMLNIEIVKVPTVNKFKKKNERKNPNKH